MRTELKFGHIIEVEKLYIYLDSTKDNVFLSEIINKELTRRILQRYQSLSSNQEAQRGHPVYKVVRLTTEEFVDMGARCYKTLQDSNFFDLVNPSVVGELNEQDKKDILDELLMADGFTDKALQELLKKYKTDNGQDN